MLPHILPFSFGDETLNEGDTVAVQCIASKGDLPIGINWYHEGKPLLSENGINIMKSPKISTLNIESVQGDHRGNYTCVTTNRAGRVEYTATLNING